MAKFQIDRGESDRASLTGGAPRSTRSKACSSCLIGVGLILGCGSLLAGLLLPKIIDQKLIDASVVCSKDSENYESWAHPTEKGKENVELTYENPSNRYFYVYNIANAPTYVSVKNTKAEVEELGPYVSKCYSAKFDVTFDDDKPQVSYKSYGYCEFDETSDKNCEGCTTGDSLYQLNAGWGQVLTSAGNEGIVVLKAAGCSVNQIGAIALIDPSKNILPCDWTTGAPNIYGGGVVCGCCVPDRVPVKEPPFDQLKGSDVVATLKADYPGYNPMPCSGPFGLTGDNSAAVAAISGLAYYDSGVPTGRLGYDSKGTGTPLFTPLVLKKTVKQLAFGYPSILTGFLVQAAVIEKSLMGAKAYMEKVNPGKQFEKVGDELYDMYQGVKLQSKISGLATDVGSGWSLGGYTADVVEACEDNCKGTAGLECSGPAGKGKKYLSGTDCKPLSVAYLVNKACAGTDIYYTTLETTNPDPCICSDGTPYIPGKPCCFAQGTYLDEKGKKHDATGKGCLASIPGFLQTRNLYTEAEGAKFYATKPAAILEDTGCDSSKLGKDVMEVLKANGVEEAPVWYNGVKGIPTFVDVQNFQKSIAQDTAEDKKTKLKFNTISGKDGGTQIQATGLKTRGWATAQFNNNKPSVETVDIYVSQVSEAVTLKFEGPHNLKGVDLQRYTPSDELLVGCESGCEEKMGGGVGVVDGLAIATFVYGFPIAVSHPNYLFGANSLYDNINLKQMYDYDTGKKLAEAIVMNSKNVKDQSDRFRVAIDIEPSTGKAMLGHNRLMASLYVYSCNLSGNTQPQCGLFQREGASCSNPFLKTDYGWACSAANVFTPNVQGDIFIPTYWIDEWSELPDDKAEALVTVFKQLQMVDAAAAVGGVIGLVLFFFGLISLCMGGKR